jgi:4-aminobutyrate aminotransferase-like enzyme/Ser/Thr protein kinase RdoA (MazF antagonist)
MSLLDHAPRIDVDAARQLARDLYRLDAAATPLTSERDQNFLLTTAGGERFVLKIANALEERAQVDAQNAALAVVRERAPVVPSVVAALDGALVAAWNGHFVRLLTWLDGVPLAEVAPHSASLLRDLGRVVGVVDDALTRFDHPAAHREFHWDLATGVATCRARVSRIGDAFLRGTVERLLDEIETGLAPLGPRLPKSVIHGDANDYNVIVSAPIGETRAREISGLIDFGDMVHSYTVGGLAVAIAYAILDKRDPITAAADVVAGYHTARPLEDDEIAATFDLVRLRLCLSACIGATQMAERPDDPYLAVSQAPLRRTLPMLAGVHRRLAEYTFRAACGLTPVPSTPAVEAWIAANGAKAAPVLGHDLRTTPTMVLDLGVGSPLVSGDARENDEPALTARIRGAIHEAGATVAVGRYDEARLLYTSSLFAVRRHVDPGVVDQRTVHLGIDLFAAAGTPVFAPIDGVVHAFANNSAPLDYGPVIVLEHAPAEGVRFFTVYGHLSLESLDGRQAGQHVGRGDRLGTLGASGVNGGWTPHLHFQIVTDGLDLEADFPGVAHADARAVWLSLSPDPSPLLHVSPAARADEADPAVGLALRRAATGRNVGVSYAEPVQVARGWMQYLYDADGRRYLDGYNNVPHVGHAHPHVVRAVSDQLRVLNTNTRYLHDSLAEFAAALTGTLPPLLRVCYFVNSGSEANDLALRLARAHTRGTDVIVLEGAYHGITTSLIDISPYKHAGPGGTGAPPWVHAVPMPDDYRGVYRRGDPDAGPKYAALVAGACRHVTSNGGRLAGFIAESCPSVGGQIILPPGYFAAAYRAVREAGGVAIADEVQTAYGRLGTSFWGFEPQDVVPDIVVLGKPIGNGYPIGAVVTTPEIAASFDNGMEFFSTFGGSTVSCAAGLAVLDVVLREGLQAHARRVGERMLGQLRPFIERYSIVGDVRGSGLFLGIELVRDRETLEPATSEASYIVNRLREEGILIGTDGPFHNVLKIRPPMPFDDGDADRLVWTLRAVLDEMRPAG